MPAIATTSPDFSTVLGAAINSKYSFETDLVDGAIAIKEGVVFITKATAAALTLALPVAGTDDIKTLRIISKTAAAHVITTPATGLNLTLHIATFAANIGSAVELVAIGGSWYMQNGVGCTLS